MHKIVKLIRLLSGEDIVAEIVTSEKRMLLTGDFGGKEPEMDLDSGNLTIKNPLQLIVVPQGEKMAMKFAPWVPFRESEEHVTIRASTIVYVTNADKKLVEQYNQITSPIQQPPQGLILPDHLRNG